MRQHILQQSTELLVVTLAHVLPGKEREARVHIRTVAEALKSAPGLISTRIYRGRNGGIAYLLLTTWEDEESWLNAQERHTPKKLLQSAQNLLTATPEQWLMYYVWGYTRPTPSSQLAAIHLITVPSQAIEMVQTNWLAGLRQPDLRSLLTFAFLARGLNDTLVAKNSTTDPHTGDYWETIKIQSTTLASFLSWGNEVEREAYYADAGYQSIKSMAEHDGTIYTLVLELI
jgi:heme-degrading monooxygenase HmoA